ncbi:hypothetical protein H4F99_03435 [Lysobacter sp. SG-8]|uniref:Uncharacterized protein n=1 Tax=Marilutibacter penaei TaxID=2759900 RepID=A0A7W3U244_9GAMM|nr:hypothetical protein [Lysobacter penaei]MBB1087537.1 hypothetical protein [Lysobacter penaei]
MATPSRTTRAVKAIRPTGKSRAALSEVRLSVTPDMPFDDLVGLLKETLTVPELPGIRGCRPCLSGLDRFIIEDLVMKGMR